MSEQIKITVIEEVNRKGADGRKSNRKETVLLHDTGETLLHTLREGGITLPSLCGSIGKCGRCQVRFQGNAPLPSQSDRAMIAPDKLREGYRLACMARPRKNCQVEAAFGRETAIDVVVGSNVKGGWRDDSGKRSDDGSRWDDSCRYGDGNYKWQDRVCVCTASTDSIMHKKPCRDEEKHEIKKRMARAETAVAVDIGTTTIAMQLIDMESGRVLDTYTCLNPQRSYGVDVISRIRAGTRGEGERLKQLVRKALAAGLEEMLGRSSRKGGIREEAIWNGEMIRPKLMVISANTVMGHLFMGYPVESLGRSPFLPVDIKTISLDFLGIPTVLIPGISAFVGGDIVSGLYACGLCPCMENASGIPEGKAWLFLDLGTNAEMVIGKGKRMACTAAAAGPAFEGRGKQGKTGSERIEAIAHLLETGISDRAGLLEEPYFENGIEVGLENKEGKIRIFQEDIRDIQMAKAAVRAGIYFLMERMGIKDADEIERVYVAGGFGFYLKKKAAVEIGLIPAELEEKVETVGNTSLAGAKMISGKMTGVNAFSEGMDVEHLWEGAEAEGLLGMEGIPGMEVMMELEALAQNGEAFQLAEEPLFEEKYIEYMNF